MVETWILPKRHESHFEETEAASVQNLAWGLRRVLRMMDRVLERPPFNLIIHSAPVQEPALAHYHWHIEITPQLSKVAGFEWGTGFYMNPTPPEEAARFLREADGRGGAGGGRKNKPLEPAGSTPQPRGGTVDCGYAAFRAHRHGS